MTSIVFMGTPQFSVPILESLIAHDEYDVVAVVTQPDRYVGRKHVLTASPVKQAAQKHDIEVLQPEKMNHSDEMQRVIDLAPDLIVTAAFGQFLPTKLLNSVKVAAINVHASLLPKYRGGAPVHYAIMNGDHETGVSIMYMIKQMDAGDILAQRSIPITTQDDTGTMFDKLSLLGRDLLLETIPKLLSNEIQPVKQDENLVSFSPNITSEQEELDFNQTAHQLDCKVRGLRPFPIANVILNGQRTKILDVEALDETTEHQPGEIVLLTKHELTIAAGNHSVLAINKLKPAGKAKMDITAYLNGHPNLKQGMQVIFNGDN